MQSADALVPRASGDTPVSRALVELVAVPRHSVAAPEHSVDAVACDTLTGPDTAAAFLPAGSRSATCESVFVVQEPPVPCTAQPDEPVLSRTPATSPDAAPDVVDDPEPA